MIYGYLNTLCHNIYCARNNQSAILLKGGKTIEQLQATVFQRKVLH